MFTLEVTPEQIDEMVLIGLNESLGYLLKDMELDNYYDDEERQESFKMIKAVKRVIKYYGGKV
jgi:hypothetical protein